MRFSVRKAARKASTTWISRSLGGLAASLGYKYVAIDHGAEQESDADLGIDAAAQNSSLFSALDDVGQRHAGRLDDPGAPDGTHRAVARGIGDHVGRHFFPQRLAVGCRLILQLGDEVGTEVAGVEDRRLLVETMQVAHHFQA